VSPANKSIKLQPSPANKSIKLQPLLSLLQTFKQPLLPPSETLSAKNLDKKLSEGKKLIMMNYKTY